jgi:hypothetical protein
MKTREVGDQPGGEAPLDTLDPRQVAAWRAMSPAQRLELAWRVTRRMQGDPTLGW